MKNLQKRDFEEDEYLLLASSLCTWQNEKGSSKIGVEQLRSAISKTFQ